MPSGDAEAMAKRLTSQSMSVEELRDRPMPVTRQQMNDAQLPLAWRDHCAHKLIDLNECRVGSKYLPWTCSHEKHSYEKCLYKEYLLRMKAQVDGTAAAKAEAAAEAAK